MKNALQIAPNDLQKFTNMMVFDVDMQDGSKTKVVTFFNCNDIGHEEMHIGIRKALEFTPNSKKFNTSLFKFKNKNLIASGFGFFEHLINHYKPSF
jgi:hypothetical protein